MEWPYFDNDAFECTPAGNDGKLALPWYEAETTPLVQQAGMRANFDFKSAQAAVKIRAAVEAQALTRLCHSLWVGDFDTIRVTGGASKSPGIRQTLANVFQARVESIAVADSAALGGAMIAAHCDGSCARDNDRPVHSGRRNLRARTPLPQMYIKSCFLLSANSNSQSRFDQEAGARHQVSGVRLSAIFR